MESIIVPGDPSRRDAAPRVTRPKKLSENGHNPLVF